MPEESCTRLLGASLLKPVTAARPVTPTIPAMCAATAAAIEPRPWLSDSTAGVVLAWLSTLHCSALALSGFLYQHGQLEQYGEYLLQGHGNFMEFGLFGDSPLHCL